MSLVTVFSTLNIQGLVLSTEKISPSSFPHPAITTEINVLQLTLLDLIVPSRYFTYRM